MVNSNGAEENGLMNGRKALRTICAALCLALLLDIGVCLLPENSYQRWRLLDGTIYGGLRWTYERIHFDPRPVDVAIVGPSRTQLGLSAAMIEERLRSDGKPANVANFSLEASGRNLNWAIVDELYKSKAPKVIVIGIDSTPFPYGHPAFKYIAPAGAIAFPPQPLLHDYLYDLAYLPSRKMKLLGAHFFPDLFGGKEFDPEVYRKTRTDYSSSFTAEGKLVDMDREIPRATLLAQAPPPTKPSLFSRVLTWCCNDGDDRVYIREIAREAKAHGTQLMFVRLPAFNEAQDISDRKFLEQYGPVLDNADLAQQDKLYENWSHLNHAGAVIASDRLANSITQQKL
jgi:hypothetical protein